ncbi:ChbG/HpnK family deacetylase [Achromobacter mucicolens]|uniref:ChbG/HpnK family deacetylase n=1 Tax=Achromobacter mucicolens TaxID=1389922 RepID=UPI001CBBDF0E|nr:ChbG/HpnK family deacetylase [Achromobacter mucicolens]UAN02048.1 ChbG/HpnK family deacetylase [Achromobacter mucicolens]
MSKRVVVCGDDFGMNADVDEGMIALAGMRRVSAVSCLSLAPTFAANAPRLAAQDVDIGLHLNFSETLRADAEPLPSLGALILKAYAGRLDAAWIDARLDEQFDAFEAAFGRAPDYVDGHQHVHQLPGIRKRVLARLAQRYGTQRPWLRQTAPGMQCGIPLKESFKAHVIGALGAAALARDAHSSGLRTNRRLLGVYAFDGGQRRYAQLLQTWLFNAREGDLVMCHPALGFARSNEQDSAMARQRRAEFDVLASPKLGDWLDANGVRITRLALTRADHELPVVGRAIPA